jgi:hypothetical protein
VILEKIVSNTDWPFVLDIHPHITVVAGLGDERRARMASMIDGILRGEMYGLEAQVEIEGESYAFSPDRAIELGLTESEISPMLREIDLPGVIVLQEYPKEANNEPQQSELSDEEIREEVEAQLPLPVFEEEPQGNSAMSSHQIPPNRELVSAEELSRHDLRVPIYIDDLRGPLRTAWIALERAREERDRSEDELNKLSTRGDEMRAPSGSNARAAYNRAQSQLEEIEMAIAQGGDAEGLIESRKAQLTALYRERDLATQQLNAIENQTSTLPVDTSGVQRAFSALLAARDAVEQQRDIPSPRAQALLNELNDVEARLHAHKPKNAPTWLVEQTQKQLEDSQRRLSSAESEFKMATADSTDVQAVEQAHAEVVAGEEAASKFFGGGKARQQLEGALAKEQTALQRIGLPNYESFRLQLGSLGRDRGVIETMLERAKKEFAEAEAMWDELQSPTDDAELQAMKDERDKIVNEAQAIVGQFEGRELSEALASYHEPPTPPIELENKLWQELETVGVPRADVPVDVIAETWLEERAEVEARHLAEAEERQQLRDKLANAEASVVQAEDELTRLQARLASLPSADDMEASRVDAQRALADAERELRSAEQAEQAVGDIETETASMNQTLEAAQLVYDKSRAILIEAVEQLRAQESVSNGAVVPETETQRVSARQKYETQLAAVKMQRQQQIASLIKSRDDRIDSRFASQRWDSPYYQAPELDISAINNEEVEVFVLSRLSGLRIVGHAGALPLVIDDAFKQFDDKELNNMLGLFARVSRVMQVIYLSDDPRVQDWALDLGEEAARVQRFSEHG